MKELRYVGLDVHAETVSIAVCDSEILEFVGGCKNSVSRIIKQLKKLGEPETLRIVYEAGPTGYGLYRALRKRGYHCEIIAPTLVPQMPGERVKTDRRDALKLAKLYRAGLLTSIYIPSESTESLRDLVRCREAAKSDELCARHRLSKFLLRHDVRRPSTMKKNWTKMHMLWLNTLKFDDRAQTLTFENLLHEVEHQQSRVSELDEHIDSMVGSLDAIQQAVVAALQGMRGIAQLTAVTLVTEIGDFSRFSHPSQLMAYAGLVPREHSSGESVRRGAMTKTGNAHIRRVMGEAAWAYRHPARTGYALRKRQEGLSENIKGLSRKCQKRLHQRYKDLGRKGKHHNKVMGAIARELLGFTWAVAIETSKEYHQNIKSF